MTTEELAECLGVAKQTVNRWIREKGWKTEKFPGVKGGRARLILVDTQVCEFIQNTPASITRRCFWKPKNPLPNMHRVFALPLIGKSSAQ